MASINFNNLLTTVTTDNYVRKVANIDPSKFSQSIIQISDQQSRDKNYEKGLEYIRTYIASLQAKINSLIEELNIIYENTLTETLFRRADSLNTAKKVNKLRNVTEGGVDPSSLGAADTADATMTKTDITPNHDLTRMFTYNPFFGTKAADLSNYYNLSSNNTVSTARAYYQTTDNDHHEFGASALGALGYLWQWDLDRINASYATTMDKYIDKSGVLHISPNDPAAGGNPSGTFLAGGGIYVDPALAIVGTSNNTDNLQVNITALQPNRGLADISGPDAPKTIVPITNLNSWPGFQAGDITYTNGVGYSFTPPVGNQLFFDTEKWAVVDAQGKEPTMEVLTRVTRELIPLEDFGTYNAGAIPNGATAFGNWVNQTGPGQTLSWNAGGQPAYWKPARGGTVHISNDKSFVDEPLHAPTSAPPELAYAQGTLFADDGWALYIKNTSDPSGYNIGTATPILNGGVPDTDGTWTRISHAGGYTTTYFSTSGYVPDLDKDVTFLVTGKDGGWAGGGPSRSGLKSYGLEIGARTFREDTATQKRYVVDESGNIIDRFGITGSNGNYGHFNGSFQVSNPNGSPENKYANGVDDYNLYDYVPDPTSAGPSSSVGTIPDLSVGDFFYYRENLNADNAVVNNNRPNITFDPRGTNMQGRMSVTTNRIEIKNTDFAMFGNTFLTYVEQNQDIYNQSKVNSFATWVGESDKDYVANNDSVANGEKDYKMTLNFENKDENGVGILSAVRRVHVTVTGEPSIQDQETDDWDSRTWQRRQILDQQINPWTPDASTGGIVNTDGQSGDSAIPLTVSGAGASFDVQSLTTLVTPGYWTANGSKSIYVNEPWNNQQVFTPDLDVQPDRLSSVSGHFTISGPNTPAGDLVVQIEYFDGSSWVQIPGSNTCTHIGCTGHSAWAYNDPNGDGNFEFNLPAPPAVDGMQFRVSGTVSGSVVALGGTLTMQANKERYIEAVYADKQVTKDIMGTGANLSTYRNARIVLNNNTQQPVAGAQVERIIQYRNNAGAWTDLIANPPEGAISVDLPASANGNVDVRAVVRVKAFAAPASTPAVNDIWNISDMRIVGEPIPDEPKTLGLEMTKGYYNGVEQTGGGIINPISSSEATYAPAYAAQQDGVQNFYTDINGLAGFNMYMNKDEFEIARKKNPVVNDATVQVTVEYVEDTNQDGRISAAESAVVKTKLIGVNDATRNTMSGNRRLSDTDVNQAFTVFDNTINVGKGRSGGADEKTGNENKLTKRLKQVLDSTEWQEVLKYGLLDNMFIAATASDNRGDQMTGKLLLNWDWRRRRVQVDQLFFSAIYKA
jgi:hypothetical protein